MTNLEFEIGDKVRVESGLDDWDIRTHGNEGFIIGFTAYTGELKIVFIPQVMHCSTHDQTINPRKQRVVVIGKLEPVSEYVPDPPSIEPYPRSDFGGDDEDTSAYITGGDPELQPGPEHVREEVAPMGSSRTRDC